MRIIKLVALLAFGSAIAYFAYMKIIYGDKHSIKSKFLNEERAFLVKLPEEYDPSNKYPVIFLLDGGYHYDKTINAINKATQNQKMQRSILVTIGNTDRNRDFLHTHVNAVVNEINGENSGGSHKFLAFLEEELIPFIDKNYSTSDDRTIIGHSLAGLFVLYSFVEKPSIFSKYLAVDPSIWWDDWELTTRLKSKDLTSNKAKVYFSTANNPYRFEIIDGLNEFTDHLTAEIPENFINEFFENEVHGTIPLVSIESGLLHLNAK